MLLTTSPSGTKTYYTTPNTFEKEFGYHRAVRKGPFIFVSGTTAQNPETGKIEYSGDAYQQALATMGRCVEGVKKLGGAKKDVVRVRMFVAVSHMSRGRWCMLGSY
jgi:enamine deaminase RidA (YjgF/YER057c/UK114 family)